MIGLYKDVMYRKPASWDAWHGGSVLDAKFKVLMYNVNEFWSLHLLGGKNRGRFGDYPSPLGFLWFQYLYCKSVLGRWYGESPCGLTFFISKGALRNQGFLALFF